VSALRGHTALYAFPGTGSRPIVYERALTNVKRKAQGKRFGGYRTARAPKLLNEIRDRPFLSKCTKFRYLALGPRTIDRSSHEALLALAAQLSNVNLVHGLASKYAKAEAAATHVWGLQGCNSFNPRIATGIQI